MSIFQETLNNKEQSEQLSDFLIHDLAPQFKTNANLLMTAFEFSPDHQLPRSTTPIQDELNDKILLTKEPQQHVSTADQEH